MSATMSLRQFSAPFALALLFTLASCATPHHRATPSPHYKIGKPYQVKGRWYYPKEDPDYQAVGVASWYGRDFHGRKTANGEIFDMNAMSAAHKTLPLPSIVEVTNLENGRKIRVRVNDRGPFARNRVIDMSRAAARRLGFEQNGLARVRVRYVGGARLAARASRQGEPIVVAAAAPVHATPVIDEASGHDEEVSAVISEMENTPAPTPEFEVESEPDVIASADNITAETIPDEPTIIEASATAVVEPVEMPIIDLSKAPESVLEALYVIRIATLSRPDNIEALKQELADTGAIRVSRIENADGGVFYRINMGPYASIEAAAAPLDAVRAAGYGDASVVTLTP